MVATELAVFLLGDGAGGTGAGSFDELRESHENGLLNLRPVVAGAGGGAGGAGIGSDDVAGTVAGATLAAGGLFDWGSLGWGDQGNGGKTLVMLLKDMVLAVCSLPADFSVLESVLPATRSPCDVEANSPSCVAAVGVESSSRFTLSREPAEAVERRRSCFWSTGVCSSTASAAAPRDSSMGAPLTATGESWGVSFS